MAATVAGGTIRLHADLLQRDRFWHNSVHAAQAAWLPGVRQDRPPHQICLSGKTVPALLPPRRIAPACDALVRRAARTGPAVNLAII